MAADARRHFAAWKAWHAAAALYEALSKLSDAQLERRGIARGDLARLVAEQMSKEHSPTP
jgi:hypothetical protein